MKKLLIIIITTVVGLLLLLAWFMLIDVREVISNLQKINPAMLLIAVIFYVLSFFIRSLRWNIIMRRIKAMGMWRTFVLYMAGNYINFLVPIRAGELAKSLFLKKMDNIPVSTSFPAIVFDKILDLLPVFLIIILVPFVGLKLGETLWLVILIVFVICLILFTLYYLGIRSHRALFRLFKISFFWLPKKIKPRVLDFFSRGIYGLSIAKQKPAALASIVLLTFIAVLTDTLYMSFILRAFGIELSLLLVFIGYTLFNLSYVLPTPPAQIGSVEVILLLIFSGAFGIEKNLMSSVIIIIHSITGIYILFSGIISTTSLGIGVIETIKRGSKA
ncbi:MAG TPA: lysylphosphatidylglycerol synthase transmembrane domain-containing protein [Candidatus Nanoarchaeia archaeon]|nr:lysylphosphatidylglycerol synthase transmembrane domain-containing protein [Candidatus Nanoarchaeia archaeon]